MTFAKHDPITWTYTLDAWNRLVLVENGATNIGRQIKVYNSLNWRIRKGGKRDGGKGDGSALFEPSYGAVGCDCR